MPTTRRVTVGYDYTAGIGDCIVLEVIPDVPGDRFLIPLGQAESVAEAIQRIYTDIAGEMKDPR